MFLDLDSLSEGPRSPRGMTRSGTRSALLAVLIENCNLKLELELELV